MTGPDPSDPRFNEELTQQTCFNIEAEQAVLGTLMFNNEVLYDIQDGLSGFDFYEPFHQRVYDAVVATVRSGRLAEPMYLQDFFEADPAYQEFGGLEYLFDLIDKAPPSSKVSHFADIVTDNALRRHLIEASGTARDSVSDYSRTALELVLEAERNLGQISMNGPQAAAFQNIGDLFAKQFQRSKTLDGLQPGISTGIPDLDAKLGGFRKQNVVILGGRPGMGKSAAAVQFAINVATPSDEAQKGRGVAFFSLEMPEEQVATRFGCALAYERDADPKSNPTYEAFEKGELDDIQWQKLERAGQKLAAMPIEIDFRGKLKVSQMLAAARRMKREWAKQGIEPGLIIIDHVLMVSPEKRVNDKVVEISQIADDILDMAKTLDMPILVLAQLSRDIDKRDDKRPNLGDLKWSGSLEENAAAVIFCYRPEYYNKTPAHNAKDGAWKAYEAIKEKFTDRLIFLLEKNRNGRAHQSIKAFCSIAHNVIQNLSDPAAMSRSIDFSQTRVGRDDDDEAMDALYNDPQYTGADD